MRDGEIGGAARNTARRSLTGKPRRNSKLISITTIIIVGVCTALFAAEPQGVVLVGAGSSVPLPLYRKWADLYNQNNKTVQLQYVALGTVEGIAQITHGTSDFGAGEVPLTAEERLHGNLTELPVVLIGIVPIYNLPNIQNLRLSGDVLAEVYLGRISHWNDPAIVKLNPGTSLPNLPIRVIYRPAGKGSNYVFTEYLSKVNAKFREQIGRSASPKWLVGQPAERSSDMADKVKSTPGSLGYVELQYADDNQITHASVLNAAGKFVKATAASITASCVAVEAPAWDKLAGSLTNAPGADSYPISSFTWLYVRPSARDQRRTTALVSLLNWAYSDGQSIAIQEGYSDLPKPLVAKVLAKVNGMH
ncbi:MAG TPA: phosphate ABC transporter substrate-binding protein PstS [Alphaproteobacteria bacterium]|nr:phosphate ABC transporter substrate-binding protein PstS [Alphaproteobacteria bacterium]